MRRLCPADNQNVAGLILIEADVDICLPVILTMEMHSFQNLDIFKAATNFITLYSLKVKHSSLT